MNPRIAIHTTDAARAQAGPAFQWLWQGYLATGMVTLFTSRWKTGKTTLLSFLLNRREQGGTLADGAVAAGRTVVVSEEPLGLWMSRADKLGFGANVHWCSRPFPVRPDAADWENLILELCGPDADLIVFDPLAMVLPGDVENNATAMLAALDPLRLLTSAGKAVLILHHPKKNSPAGELSPRGSGALAGFADILVDLTVPDGLTSADRRRRLRSASRLHESTEVLLELAADGREYATVPQTQENFDQNWTLLKSIFDEATDRLTRQKVHKYWPPDFEKPSLSTVTRWLDRALKENRIVRKGKGTYRDPYVFSLPGFKRYLDELPPLRDLWK